MKHTIIRRPQPKTHGAFVLPKGKVFKGGSSVLPAGQEFHCEGGSSVLPAGQEFHCEGGSSVLPAGQEFHCEEGGEADEADGSCSAPPRGS